MSISLFEVQVRSHTTIDCHLASDNTQVYDTTWEVAARKEFKFSFQTSSCKQSGKLTGCICNLLRLDDSSCVSEKVESEKNITSYFLVNTYPFLVYIKMILVGLEIFVW